MSQLWMIKAVGYDVWVSEIVQDPSEMFPIPKLTLIRDKAYYFKRRTEAEYILSILKEKANHFDYVIKEVF